LGHRLSGRLRRAAPGLSERGRRSRLAAHPEIGANHYLYGRLLKDKDQALAEYDEAVRRDPKLGVAFAAKGYSLLGKERYAEALAALQSAIDLPGHESQTDVLYAKAAVGAGAVERAEVMLRREKDPEDPQELWQARWILALAAGRFDDAERLFDERHPAETLSPDDWDLRVQLARLAGKKPELDKLLAGARLRKDLAASLASVHLEQALAEKRFRDASAVVDKELPPVHGRPTLSHVYSAAALLLAGDRPQADEHLAELSAALGPQRPGEFNLLGALTEALRSPISGEKPEEQWAADLIHAAGAADPDLLPHVYFILGTRAAAAGDAVAAKDFFARSRKTALTLDFPYLAAKALAE
jgi:Tfp pilus assembly protein PilF